MNRDTELETALIKAYCERGDQNAFAELVRRYSEPVFRLAVSILGQGFSAEAEEVAQEVFLRVHHGLTAFRGEAHFGSWIYRITFNQAVNLKSRACYRAPHLNEQVLEQMQSDVIDPLKRLETARRDESLSECISELPDVYQSALRLYYWMGTSLAEIGILIGVPENTVKSYLHRSRRLLHVMLKEKGFEDV